MLCPFFLNNTHKVGKLQGHSWFPNTCGVLIGCKALSLSYSWTLLRSLCGFCCRRQSRQCQRTQMVLKSLSLLHWVVQPVASEPQVQVPYSFYCRGCHGAAGVPALLKWLWEPYIPSAQPQPPWKNWDQVETRAIAVEGGICVVAFRLVPHPCANWYWYLRTGGGKKERKQSLPAVLQVQDQVQPCSSWH